MKVAEDCASMSRAIRLQVGSVVVKDNNIISFSWNGMPSGWDNNCEQIEWCGNGGDWGDIDDIQAAYPFKGMRLADSGTEIPDTYRLKSNPEVLHAEMNALMKLAKTSGSGNGACIFVTHSPCLECAKGIYQAGITEVYFKEEYRSSDGINFLKKCNIQVEQINGSVSI